MRARGGSPRGLFHVVGVGREALASAGPCVELGLGLRRAGLARLTGRGGHCRPVPVWPAGWVWGGSELLVPHSHPSALSSARHLCCLGSQAVEITSEGQVVLFFSQKIGKRENSCPPGHIGCGCQRVLCAWNTVQQGCLFHLWVLLLPSTGDSGSMTETASQMPPLSSEALGSKTSRGTWTRK